MTAIHQALGCPANHSKVLVILQRREVVHSKDDAVSTATLDNVGFILWSVSDQFNQVSVDGLYSLRGHLVLVCANEENTRTILELSISRHVL
jgi:hypothetical protein